MARLLARAHLAVVAFAAAARRHWRRIAVGAFVGWLVSSVAGAFVLVWFESTGLIDAETSPLVGAALVWGGMGVGALLAYAARPRARPRARRDVRRA